MDIDLKKIKELLAAMEAKGVSRLRIAEDGQELELERKSKPEPAAPPPAAPAPVAAPAAAAPAPAAAPAEPSGPCITAPMVGSFYAAPSPDADDFVKVGDKVKEDTVVCIIEAMKVMNEVKAGVAGTIKEILIESGHPVEFGTKLFVVG